MPAHQKKPPAGIVFIADHEDEHGRTVPGIATRLGIAPSTYRKWRMAGLGPNTFYLGKKVAASEEAVDAYLAGLKRAASQPRRESRPPEPRVAGGAGRRPRKHTATPSAA